MGNQLSGAAPGQIFNVENYLSELPPEKYKTATFQSLGSTRFFKVAQLQHDEGPVVVKVLAKHDPSLQLQSYHAQLQEILDVLESTHNCLPFQAFFDTERAGIIVRQYVRDNLYDRISTRPFLSSVEKRWILFLLLHALKETHGNGVCHGDIKTENVMVTSWNWVLLTDFASFKPTFLPEDDPADFSFFFDTSRRRVCNIAPERFVELRRADDQQQGRQSPSLRDQQAPAEKVPAEGVAKAGVQPVPVPVNNPAATITPGREGQPATVTFSSGADSPNSSATVDNSMKREIFQNQLTKAMDIFSLGCVAAELFTEGKSLFDLSQLLAYREGNYDPEALLAVIEDDAVKDLIRAMIALNPAKRPSASDCLNQCKGTVFPVAFYSFLFPYCRRFCVKPILTADDRIGRLRRDLSNDGCIVERLVEPCRAHSRLSGDKSSKNGQLPMFGGLDCLLVVLSVVTSSVRHCKSSHAKLAGLDQMQGIGKMLSDALVLERVVPFMAYLLADDSPAVRAGAVRTLAQTLRMVKNVPRSEANLFPEYILPAVNRLSTDVELVVRIALAENIAALAETALRFLEISQADFMLQGRSSTAGFESLQYQGSYDTELLALHEMTQKLVVALLCDPVNTVKRTLLGSGISQLCVFFGRQKANDVLLSHMITFQNDKHDWQLRGAFFDSIVAVASYVGSQSLNMVMPLLQQGLTDIEESVVHKALKALINLCKLGLLHKSSLLELAIDVLPFLCHPNVWLQYGAVGFLSSIASKLNVADLHCQLLPPLHPYLKAPISQVHDEVILMTALRPPLSRHVYDVVLREPRVDALFEHLEKRHQLKTPSPFSDDVKHFGDDLKSLGGKLSCMTQADENYLLMLRSYIMKVRRVWTSAPDMKDVAAQTAGVVLVLHGRTVNICTLTEGQTAVSMSGKASTSKKAAATEASLPMNEEWNQMFGGPRTISTADVSDGRSAMAARNTRRKSERKVRSDTTPAITTLRPAPVKVPAGKSRASTLSKPSSVGTGVSASPTSTGLSTATSGQSSAGATVTSDERVNFPAAKPPPKPAAKQTPTASGTQKAATLSGLRSGGRSQGGAQPRVEIRYRQCRYDLTKLLQDKQEQHEHDSVRMKLWNETIAERNEARKATSSWLPQGILVAHLQEHKGAVNRVCVAENNQFFATCSDDGTVRLWDCARLEGKTVLPHRSACQYVKQGGRILCASFLQGGAMLASASSNGSLQLLSIVTGQKGMPKVTAQATWLNLNEKEHIVDMHAMSGSVIILATLHGRLLAYDVRSSTIAWSLDNDLNDGLVTGFVLDPLDCWLALGTTAGTHTCWDMRFHLPVTHWVHPAGLAVQCLAAHPTEQSSVLSATHGNNEVAVWNMEAGSRTQAFWGCSASPLTAHRASAHYIRAICSHRALGPNRVLLGGTDRRIRVFDLVHPLDSNVLISLCKDHGGSYQPAKYRKLVHDGIEVLQEQTGKAVVPSDLEKSTRRGPEPPPPGHHDAITDLAITRAGQNFLISSSRDGVVKVWK